MKVVEAAADARVSDRFRLDHRQLEEVFQRLLDAFEADDREQVAALWTAFDAQLQAHMDAEERFFIPSLIVSNERAARAILQEHRLFRSRLMELAAQVDLHVIRLETARAFVDELRAHAAHEDKALYGWADQHLAEEKRISALSTLAGAAKARLLARTGLVQ